MVQEQAMKIYNRLERAEDTRYVGNLNKSLKSFFFDLFRTAIRKPGNLFFFLSVFLRQKAASSRRAAWSQKGLQVPPLIFISVTTRCNLKCRGCYSHAIREDERIEVGLDRLTEVIRQARDLGVSIIVLAGGEPLMRPELLNITEAFPDMLFLLFTNGLLIDEEISRRFRKQRNTIPIISIEGGQSETDSRRGDGVYRRIRGVIKQLSGSFYGVSITVTAENFQTVTEDEFVSNLMGLGCGLVLFVEFSSFQPDTEHLLLSGEQRSHLVSRSRQFRKDYPGLFVAVPGDEEQYGGCLAAGRGFLHINSHGDVEPCPFAPVSDININDVSLEEALRSNLLREIRKTPELLTEEGTGCALMKRKEELETLALPVAAR